MSLRYAAAAVGALALALLALGGGVSAEAGPAAGCQAATVRLGQAPGAIDFSLRCRPYAGRHSVRFALGLSPLRRTGQVKIRAFRRHPAVREGSAKRHGRCSLSGNSLSCAARARATIALAGRLWLAPGSVCDSAVVISEFPPAPPCRQACSGDATVRVVLNARPRGC